MKPPMKKKATPAKGKSPKKKPPMAAAAKPQWQQIADSMTKC